MKLLFVFGTRPEAIKLAPVFLELAGRPNWTMEWPTDDRLAKDAFERLVRSVQTQIELE